jgi:hypothetical protein
MRKTTMNGSGPPCLTAGRRATRAARQVRLTCRQPFMDRREGAAERARAVLGLAGGRPACPKPAEGGR